MNVIDFKEIPESHIATGDQDQFELFTRDFLEALNFQIIEGPGRGVDRGRDLLISETVGGTISKQEKLWVVSAKHKAHSGRSVTEADEPDPIGRVHKFNAQGFMGFYSTVPASGLDDALARIRTQIDCYVFDSGRIENRLISSPELRSVFQQYFPSSYDKFVSRTNSKIGLSDLSLEASQLLAKVQSGSVPLSQCIAEALTLAQKANNNSFEKFCRRELSGWYHLDSTEESSIEDPDSGSHRLVEIFLAFGVEINLDSWMWREDPNRVIRYLQQHPQHFPTRKLAVRQPISEIEARQIIIAAKGLIVFDLKLSDIVPDLDVENPDLPVKGYAHPNIFQIVFEAVRRKLTLYLLDMLPQVNREKLF